MNFNWHNLLSASAQAVQSHLASSGTSYKPQFLNPWTGNSFSGDDASRGGTWLGYDALRVLQREVSIVVVI